MLSRSLINPVSEGRMINGQPAGQPRVHTTNHLSCSSMPERDRGESDQIWIIIMRVKISLDEILPIASRIRSTACCCPSQSKILQGCHFSLHVFLLFFSFEFFFSAGVCLCVFFSLLSVEYFGNENTLYSGQIWFSENLKKEKRM